VLTDADSEANSSWTSGNTTREHRLVFNVSSVGRDEDIYLAELRLLTLVETDRRLYDGINRRVSVYELGPATGNMAVVRTASSSRQIASKLIYGGTSGWETFSVTDAVKRWVRLRTTAQVICRYDLHLPF